MEKHLDGLDGGYWAPAFDKRLRKFLKEREPTPTISPRTRNTRKSKLPPSFENPSQPEEDDESGPATAPSSPLSPSFGSPFPSSPSQQILGSKDTDIVQLDVPVSEMVRGRYEKLNHSSDFFTSSEHPIFSSPIPHSSAMDTAVTAGASGSKEEDNAHREQAAKKMKNMRKNANITHLNPPMKQFHTRSTSSLPSAFVDVTANWTQFPARAGLKDFIVEDDEEGGGRVSPFLIILTSISSFLSSHLSYLPYFSSPSCLSVATW